MSDNNEAYAITVNALLAKRADILFEIGEHEGRAERLRTQVIHIETVIRLFRPDFQAGAAPIRLRRPAKSPFFKHGEMTQRIYDALRERGEITSVDVAVASMRDKGLDPDNDPATRTDFVRRVGLQLGEMYRKGKIERLGRGKALRWRLAATTHRPLAHSLAGGRDQSK
jgi:hypothetical protein